MNTEVVDLPEARVPIVASADVLVVGGGTAGFPAALSAARNGARTVLVEKYGFLGGTATAGLVGPFMGVMATTDGGRVQLVRGIFDETIRRMEQLGGATHPEKVRPGTMLSGFKVSGHDGVTPFDPETLKYVAAELCLEVGVDLRLHSQFVQPLLDDGRVVGVVVVGKSGLQAVRASVVVDCTGDGDVAAASGAPMAKGRQSDGLCQPATLFFRIGNVDGQAVERYAFEHPEDIESGRPFASLVQAASSELQLPRDRINMYPTPEPSVWRVNAGRILRVDGTDVMDLTRAEIEGRRQARLLLQFFRKYMPGCERAVLVDTATQVGVRESRRIVGEYVITLEDLATGRAFPDVVALSCYPVDIHSPTDSSGGIRGDMPTAPVYQIPYRSLLPLEVEQLLVAGRCLSATHEALAAVRVMPACFAMGQAAGTAAAIAARRGVPPRGVAMASLHAALREQGAYLG